MYQLAEYLGLSESLLEIPFANFKNALQREWKSEDFLLSMNTVLIPILPDHPQMYFNNKLREDRVVKLMLDTLHKRRQKFEDVFLELFLWRAPFRELFDNCV